jgi:hypothetical protein
MTQERQTALDLYALYEKGAISHEEMEDKWKLATATPGRPGGKNIRSLYRRLGKKP